MNKFLLSLLGLFLLTNIALSQNNLQSPDEFLPHKVGEHFTPHYMLVDYFQHLDKNSEQLRLVQYGTTNQDRPLYVAFISSKKNLENLENIRKNNLRLAGLEDGKADLDRPISIVWLSHGVHGNEAGASESSLLTAYLLANGENREIQRWLENTVVILDPSLNPDGYSRYTHWNRNVSNQEVAPVHDALEHHEPWPGGRVNHYLFDLNRDWAWATQVETQHRLKLYQQWLPHIHADFHEQGLNDPYYFAPAAQPYHTYITDWQSDFQYEIGKNHASYFDKEGWLYFTREVFDLFYPSYGDTYPTFNGAIGMTYEQAGHGFSGRAVIMENGDTLTLSDRVNHHQTTALSTVEMASKNAARLTNEFQNYFNTVVENPPGEYKSFIIKGDNDPDKLKKLTALLDQHLIEYGSLSNGLTVPAYDYTTGNKVKHIVNKNDLIISAHQPKGLLTQVLFEPSSTLVDSLTYDITAWSLMHAYGLQGYGSSAKLTPDKQFELSSTSSQQLPETSYAYAVEWKNMEDATFLGDLLQHNIKVRYAENSFSSDVQSFQPGTLIISQADNRKMRNFDEKLRQLAEAANQQLIPLRTGFSKSGADLGSASMIFIDVPKVAILSGDQTYQNEFGQVWYYFEQNLNYPLTVIDADKINSTQLDDYNVLVLPEGSYKWNEAIHQKVQSWVKEGGKLIAIGSALSVLEDEPTYALTNSKTEAAEKADKSDKTDRTQLYRDKHRSWIPQSIPGAIYKLKLDNSHPLGFGMEDYYFSLKTSGRQYSLLKDSYNVGYVGDDPLISGFVGYKKKAGLENTATFAVQSMGSGSIVYMVDNPLYRGFWEQGKFLFSNAVFLVGQ